MPVMIFIDDTNKKWAYQKNLNSALQIFDYKDLLSFEVYENGDSVMQGKIGGTILGGLTFGVAGALVGGGGNRKITEYCSSLQVRITVNSLESPEIIISFVRTKTPKNGFVYKGAINQAKSLAATLTYIQKQVSA